MIRLASAGLAALAVVVGYAPSYAADAQLAAAVAGAQRAPENKARDGARHPAETLTFFGLKPRQTVIEISPGGGYWTEILAPYAKATGGPTSPRPPTSPTPACRKAPGAAARRSRRSSATRRSTARSVT